MQSLLQRWRDDDPRPSLEERYGAQLEIDPFEVENARTRFAGGKR